MTDNKPPALHFWKERGAWLCAVPGPDPFGSIPAMVKIRGKDWWKRYGVIGRGATKADAEADYELTKRCADFVADIY